MQKTESIKPNDIKRISDYFKENKMYNKYLAFILALCTGRKMSDILRTEWWQLVNKDGIIRDTLIFVEPKRPQDDRYISACNACKVAIEFYIKNTGCYPSENDYHNTVFSKMSAQTMLSALRKASAALNIDYEIGLNSPRQTFGSLCRQIHPCGLDGIEMIQNIYNHKENTAEQYVTMDKQRRDRYLKALGEIIDEILES